MVYTMLMVQFIRWQKTTFHGQRITRECVGLFSRSMEKSRWPCTSDHIRLIGWRCSPRNRIERPPSPPCCCSLLWTLSGPQSRPVVLAQAVLPRRLLNPACAVDPALSMSCHPVLAYNSTLTPYPTPAAWYQTHYLLLCLSYRRLPPPS